MRAKKKIKMDKKKEKEERNVKNSGERTTNTKEKKSYKPHWRI